MRAKSRCRLHYRHYPYLIASRDQSDWGLRLNQSFSPADAHSMLDELDRLRTNPHLLDLLSHYAHLGAENREAWQVRLMRLENVEPAALVKLHGELIAFGWVDQNTGQVPICYRITLPGLRAMRQAKAKENAAPDLPTCKEAA